jgi:hypothetical protein
MFVIETERGVLARMLRDSGEDELAERALLLSNDQLAQIEALGSYYTFSEDARSLGLNGQPERALPLATIDVLDDTGRDLRLRNDQGEVVIGVPVERGADERARHRELRRQAVKAQAPADQTKRILDILDPPAWGPPPADAIPELRRCFELRTKQVRDFTDEDLRIMLERHVAFGVLVGRALTRLRRDPLLESGRYPGDLLAAVLGVNAEYWVPRLSAEATAWRLADRLYDHPGLEPELRKLIRTFTREHLHRLASDFPNKR